jgi:hypothetical protein
VDLFSRFPEPPRNLFAIFAPRAEPLLQNQARTSRDKYGDSLRDLRLQLSRTLHIDVEYQVCAVRGVFT